MDDLISRQAAIDAMKARRDSAKEWYDNADEDSIRIRADSAMASFIECILTLQKLPSAQPDNKVYLCDSCRYSYPDCPSEKNDVIFGNGTGNDNICACSKYEPSTQPEKTQFSEEGATSDCISRQDAIDVIFSEPLYKSGMKKRDVDVVVPAIYEKIKSLPSAQPERKTVKEMEELLCLLPKIESADGQDYVQLSDVLETIHRYAIEPERKKGKWEIYIISMLDGEGCKCSECGFEGAPYWNFCPNCGADMRQEGEQDE